MGETDWQQGGAKYKKALKDYTSLRQLKPSDKDVLEKFKACEKEVKREAFEGVVVDDDDAPVTGQRAKGRQREGNAARGPPPSPPPPRPSAAPPLQGVVPGGPGNDSRFIPV